MKLSTKILKKSAAIILALAVSICLSVPCFASGETVNVTNVAQFMEYRHSYSRGTITIAQAKLYRGDEAEDVYVISVSGASTIIKTVNNYLGGFISGLALDTSYLRVLKRAIITYIPEGSKLVFVGHSFGGMVSQQAAADKTLKAKYEILNVLTCGSPYVLTTGREGALHRMADKSDVVPFLSTATVMNLYRDVSFEDGGYGIDFDSAHNVSYLREDLWGDYDCFGIKGGSYYLEIDTSTRVGISDRY